MLIKCRQAEGLLPLQYLSAGLGEGSGGSSAAPVEGLTPRPELQSQVSRRAIGGRGGRAAQGVLVETGGGPSRRRRVRPRGRAPVLPPPTAGPHVVDDHGLVGDNVVGLHGRPGPAPPSGGAARGTRGLADLDRRRSRHCTTPLPSRAHSLRQPPRGWLEDAPQPRPITAPTCAD